MGKFSVTATSCEAYSMHAWRDRRYHHQMFVAKDPNDPLVAQVAQRLKWVEFLFLNGKLDRQIDFSPSDEKGDRRTEPSPAKNLRPVRMTFGGGSVEGAPCRGAILRNGDWYLEFRSLEEFVDFVKDVKSPVTIIVEGEGDDREVMFDFD